MRVHPPQNGGIDYNPWPYVPKLMLETGGAGVLRDRLRTIWLHNSLRDSEPLQALGCAMLCNALHSQEILLPGAK